MRLVLSIWMPQPGPLLSPNARPHWAAKAKEKYRHRLAAMWAGVEAIAHHDKTALEGERWRPLRSATVRVIWHLAKGQKRLDPDNALASMKSAFDGLVDAEVFTGDRDLTHLPVTFERSKIPGVRVEVYEP